MKYVTVQTAAQRLGVHPDTVLARIHDGTLESVNIGTEIKPSYRIPEDAIERLARERRPRARGGSK